MHGEKKPWVCCNEMNRKVTLIAEKLKPKPIFLNSQLFSFQIQRVFLSRLLKFKQRREKIQYCFCSVLSFHTRGLKMFKSFKGYLSVSSIHGVRYINSEKTLLAKLFWVKQTKILFKEINLIFFKKT